MITPPNGFHTVRCPEGIMSQYELIVVDGKGYPPLVVDTVRPLHECLELMLLFTFKRHVLTTCKGENDESSSNQECVGIR